MNEGEKAGLMIFLCMIVLLIAAQPGTAGWWNLPVMVGLCIGFYLWTRDATGDKP